MRCPFCQFPDNRVLESRSAESGQSVRRRRECLRCNRRFTTYERIEFVPIIVIKRNGDRESFDRSKLLKGIVRACEKTGIPHPQLEGLVDEIEAELQQQAVREVHTQEIGELVLKHLRQLNEVAYIRFASVYKQFKGIKDFLEILNHLQTSSLETDAEPGSNHATTGYGDGHRDEQGERLRESDQPWQTTVSSSNH
ncbi:transcriptional regulator NrdR [Thermocoleostomius sinensis]|jgi:transcriptional repressor NrdR|uniref:Transcriptional repressor NrdR n=1 Tax=Thermocoleostomius sinensis A174 TaxID=2016057 RepID=A0A9E8ZI31_9CYAN|nr:transcriptional regulator NrdR [Thermocoleostomius sinensis]WAL58916.1 transcriptional regulator NrdR [Thermocoleostomius sinensis A174]